MTLMALALALPQWVALEPRHYPWLILLGALAAVGTYGLTEAFRSAPAAVVAPLEYTALLWGILIDRLVWHVLPSARILAGGAVVIGSGLYLIWRERSVRQPRPDAAVMEVAVGAGQNVAPISDR
jgi:drug/metabolite transporter (DMT)-like permease